MCMNISYWYMCIMGFHHHACSQACLFRLLVMMHFHNWFLLSQKGGFNSCFVCIYKSFLEINKGILCINFLPYLWKFNFNCCNKQLHCFSFNYLCCTSQSLIDSLGFSCNPDFCVRRQIKFLAVQQASPVMINGRPAVVEEKRSTNRGKFAFMLEFHLHKLWYLWNGHLWQGLFNSELG